MDSARAQTIPITPSGLNTQVSGPIAVGGKTQFNITGGTRPGDGTNLFHSFGQFGVPHNSIANFQNDAGIPTANILGRITDGNISNIYGSIQTTDFGNANLFLINPAGFLFGPNATLNVGGMVTFTSADHLRLNDGAKFNAIPSTTADALLSASPVAAFGFLGSNPGVITVQGSQLTVSNGMGISLIGGNVTIESGTLNSGTVQPARLSAPEGKVQLASTTSPGEFDAATLQPRANVNDTSFKSSGVIVLTPGSNININDKGTVSIRSGQFAITVNDALLTTTENADSSDTISLMRESSIVTSNSGADPGASIQLVSSHLAMEGALLRSSAVGEGAGGNISVNASSIALVGGAQIASSTDGNGSAGSVHIAATDSLTISGFDTTGTLTGIASDLPVMASGVFSNTSTEGVGGALTIVAPRLTVEDTGRIATFTSGDGAGGSVSIDSGEIGLKTGGRIFTGSGLDFVTFETRGNGKAGDIAVVTDSLSISGIDTFGANSAIRSKPESVGDGGSISVTARSIVLHDQGMIETIPFGTGRAGDIALTTDTLTVTGGGSVQTSGSDVKQSGTITINAKDAVSITGIGADGTPSRIMNENFGNGGTGHIVIDSKDLIVTDGAWIRSTTFFDPTPSAQPKLSLLATDSINLTRGADVRVSGFLSDVGSIKMSAQTITLADHAMVSTLTFENGNAGNISIASNGLALSGGSQIVSSTSVGTGNGGNILIAVTDMALSGRFTDPAGAVTPTAILSTSEFGSSGRGGNIIIIADRSVELNRGGSISASSTGPGDAGNILIDAGQQLDVQNGLITTKADQASGGNIDIRAIDRIRFVNSQVSASVGADSGNGGNITIDPNVVILQNSQVLAQAVQGHGGNITITTPLFLADPASLVDASSQFGVNGTVTIQSPTSNLSGTVTQLPSKPSNTQALLYNRCAALAGGEQSTFIVAGRDALPSQPGGWLNSPISIDHVTGEGPEHATGLRATAPVTETEIVSLRRLTPPGFLVRTFAIGSTGCRS
ncbi:MAG: filamentous hemagglutinin N-terminal domain-containing protein [Nitrospira sp.]|nr:filamentous hemagglutinin N-terminal domain-containing protein [Nitrospira sp.]